MPEVADLLRPARQALTREEPERALPLLQEAVSVAPESFDGRMLLAVCLWMCGRHEEGLHTSRLAVDLCPQRAEGHYNLGVMLQAAGRLEEATEHFRAALELNPDYPRCRRPHDTWRSARTPADPRCGRNRGARRGTLGRGCRRGRKRPHPTGRVGARRGHDPDGGLRKIRPTGFRLARDAVGGAEGPRP